MLLKLLHFVLRISKRRWGRIQQSQEAKCPLMHTLSRPAERSIRRNILRPRSTSLSFPKSAPSDGRSVSSSFIWYIFSTLHSFQFSSSPEQWCFNIFFLSLDHVCQGKGEVWRYGQTWQGTLWEGDEELHSTQRREEEEVQGPQCSQETPVSTFCKNTFLMYIWINWNQRLVITIFILFSAKGLPSSFSVRSTVPRWKKRPRVCPSEMWPNDLVRCGTKQWLRRSSHLRRRPPSWRRSMRRWENDAIPIQHHTHSWDPNC